MFLVSIFGAALIMALVTAYVIRFQRRKKLPKLDILHKLKRYVDLPPEPKTKPSKQHNGHIPGRKPKMEGNNGEDGIVPLKCPEVIFTSADLSNKIAKQLNIDR